jgi:hypothetical protein
VVGVAGFEPAASCSQGTRANQAALHPATSLYSSGDLKSQESLEEVIVHVRHKESAPRGHEAEPRNKS